MNIFKQISVSSDFFQKTILWLKTCFAWLCTLEISLLSVYACKTVMQKWIFWVKKKTSWNQFKHFCGFRLDDFLYWFILIELVFNNLCYINRTCVQNKLFHKLEVFIFVSLIYFCIFQNWCNTVTYDSKSRLKLY